MRIACDCVVVEVLRLADHRVEVRRLTDRAADVCCVAVEVRRLAVEVRRLSGHPVEMRRVADRAVEVRRLAVEVRRVADRAAEVRRVADRAVEVRRLAAEMCRLADHRVEVRRLAVEVRRVADRAVEVRRLSGHLAVESRRLSGHLAVESRRLAEHLADFAVDLGSSCLYSFGTASMYSFFLFAFTRQLESPLPCHQIVSNGSLQATSLQSSTTATPNGRVQIGEDGGVPERKVHTQFPR